jgi:RNA polymerase sigma-70 factor (ECF subfamily)
MPAMERMQPGTVARAAAGDGAAFRLLVDAWRGRVVAFGRRMTGNAAEAEDLAQEVFLHLFGVLRRYDPSRPFEPWMRRVMTNVVLNRLRSRPPAPHRLGGPAPGTAEPLPLPADPRSPDPVGAAAAAETAAAVRAGMAALPDPWRAVVAFRYGDGLSVAEIAEVLDLPENTVKTRLFRARAALRSSLDGLAPGREP